jgi:hypothetical protein
MSVPPAVLGQMRCGEDVVEEDDVLDVLVVLDEVEVELEVVDVPPIKA